MKNRISLYSSLNYTWNLVSFTGPNHPDFHWNINSITLYESAQSLECAKCYDSFEILLKPKYIFALAFKSIVILITWKRWNKII